MLKKQNEPLQMADTELTVDTVEGMSDGVNDFGGLKVSLKVEDVVANGSDLGMLRFGNSPSQDLNFTRILRKISRNLLADKSLR